MWLFTNTGFVSVVQIEKDLVVRSRDKESLEPISELTGNPIVNTPKSDYPYRVITNHETFAKWAHHMALNIDYSNFKSEVFQVRGADYAHALTRVWSDMHEVEDESARCN